MLLDLLPLFDEATTSGGGITRLRQAPRFTQRQTLPGFGHLHITLELHGEPAGLFDTTSHLITTVSTTPAVSSHRMRATHQLLHPTTTVTARSTVTRHMNTRCQLKDPADLWLLLDMPELT